MLISTSKLVGRLYRINVGGERILAFRRNLKGNEEFGSNALWSKRYCMRNVLCT